MPRRKFVIKLLHSVGVSRSERCSPGCEVGNSIQGDCRANVGADFGSDEVQFDTMKHTHLPIQRAVLSVQVWVAEGIRTLEISRVERSGKMVRLAFTAIHMLSQVVSVQPSPDWASDTGERPHV